VAPADAAADAPPPTVACGLAHAQVAGGGGGADGADGGADTAAAVEALIGDVGARPVLQAHAAPLSCLDHRAPGELIGSYGGDPVELVLAAAAVEAVLGADLPPRGITQLVRTYLTRCRDRTFVYHTDVTALMYLQRALGVDALDLTAPPPPLQPAILAAMRHPAAHGCHVLAAMVADPAAYDLRAQLLADVLGALHAVLWSPTDDARAGIRYYVYDVGDAVAAPLPPASSLLSVFDILATPGAPAAAPPSIPTGAVSGVLSHRGHHHAAASLANAPPTALSLTLTPHGPHRPPRVAGPPTATLRVATSPSCWRARRGLVPLPTTLQTSPPAAADARFAVLHPQAVEARRNATAALLANLFKVDVTMARDAVPTKGGVWDRRAAGLPLPTTLAADAAASAGGSAGGGSVATLPLYDVLLS